MAISVFLLVAGKRPPQRAADIRARDQTGMPDPPLGRHHGVSSPRAADVSLARLQGLWGRRNLCGMGDDQTIEHDVGGSTVTELRVYPLGDTIVIRFRRSEFIATTAAARDLAALLLRIAAKIEREEKS